MSADSDPELRPKTERIFDTSDFQSLANEAAMLYHNDKGEQAREKLRELNEQIEQHLEKWGQS